MSDDLNDEYTYCKTTGKRCFTEREAGGTINYFKNNRYKWNGRNKNIPCRKYYCKECGYYHLTHLRKVNRK